MPHALLEVFKPYGALRVVSTQDAQAIIAFTEDLAAWAIKTLNGNVPQGMQSPISVEQIFIQTRDRG